MTGTARSTKPRPPVPAEAPTASDLRELLAGCHDAWQALLQGQEGAAGEWRRFTKNSPWVFRATRGKRPQFYARPEPGAFEVTVLIGANAVKAALSGTAPKRLQTAIRNAKAYPEGRPLRVWVRKLADLRKVDELIALKLSA
jgi:hypothetical protein